MKNRIIIMTCVIFFLFSCATPGGDRGRGTGKSPADLVLAGTKNLILAPFQIALGLLAGIASMPYYLAMSLEQINRGMIDAQANSLFGARFAVSRMAARLASARALTLTGATALEFTANEPTDGATTSQRIDCESRPTIRYRAVLA